MADDKMNPPPPINPDFNYGAVTPQNDGTYAMAPPHDQGYPQEPPPKYEDPKGQELPYPAQQYQPQVMPQQYPPGTF